MNTRKHIINLLEKLNIEKMTDYLVLPDKYQEPWLDYCAYENIWEFTYLEEIINDDLMVHGLETRYKYILPEFLNHMIGDYEFIAEKSIQIWDDLSHFVVVDIKKEMTDFILGHEDKEIILEHLEGLENEPN